MNKNTLILILVFNFLVIINAAAQQAGTLTITATNFENAKGHAIVNLFREQDDIPKKPFKTIKISIEASAAKFVFHDLPNGSYAAIIYHDENDNDTLDHKLAFPSEPMGFSNDWDLSLFSGMPTFGKLKFDHNGAHTEININID